MRTHGRWQGRGSIGPYARSDAQDAHKGLCYGLDGRTAGEGPGKHLAAWLVAAGPIVAVGVLLAWLRVRARQDGRRPERGGPGH